MKIEKGGIQPHNEIFAIFLFKWLFRGGLITLKISKAMDPLLKKMNFKPEMKIQIWNAPEELNPLIEGWKNEGFLASSGEKPTFLLAFVYSKEDIDQYFEAMHALSPEDEALWVAYPKGTSKKYNVKINRDSGWTKAGELDYEAVRQIAINEDWSALRFRKLKYIKTLTRKFSAKDQ